MPESYEIDPERKLVVCRAWGAFSNEDVREQYRRLFADPLFHREYSQLADMTAVTDFTVDSATIEEVARTRQFAPGSRRAFVATKGVGFGLARMFSVYSAMVGQVLEVFTDRGRAEEWLGL